MELGDFASAEFSVSLEKTWRGGSLALPESRMAVQSCYNEPNGCFTGYRNGCGRGSRMFGMTVISGATGSGNQGTIRLPIPGARPNMNPTYAAAARSGRPP